MKLNLTALLVLAAVVLFIGLVLYQNNKKGGTVSNATCAGCVSSGDVSSGGFICTYNAPCSGNGPWWWPIKTK